MPVSNPLADVYDHIFDCLNANADFAAMFPTGTPHQVRYDLSQNYYPDTDDGVLQPADYPCCRIVMRLGKPETERDSNGSYLTAIYQIEICTGYQQQMRLFNAFWYIYCALLSWREYLKDIEWNGEYPVLDVDAKQIECVDDNKERNRGTNQWIGVWALEVTMRFTTSVAKAL